MFHDLQVLLRSLALSVGVALLASVVAAQEPTNFPEPFGSLITPRSVQDEFREDEVPQAELRHPVEGEVTAVRLGHYLVITAAVCRLPEGVRDVWLYDYPGSAKVALFGVPGGAAKGAEQPPFSKTFVRDLNDPGATAFRNSTVVNVVQPGGEMQSVPVLELPVASQD